MFYGECGPVDSVQFTKADEVRRLDDHMNSFAYT
jgi:hypothetical protein